jgi:hypothetical protein
MLNELDPSHEAYEAIRLHIRANQMSNQRQVREIKGSVDQSRLLVNIDRGLGVDRTRTEQGCSGSTHIILLILRHRVKLSR